MRNHFMTLQDFSTGVYNNSEKLRLLSIKLTRNPVDAEDLVQETYLRAFTYRHQYDPSAELKYWLFKIMKNHFINEYRKKLKISKFFFCNEYTGLTVQLNDRVSNDTETKIWMQDIYTLIESLHPIYSAPLKGYIQGFKYSEISEILDLPMGTVKRRIFYARKILARNVSFNIP